MASPIVQFKRGAFANLPGLRAGEPALTNDTYDLYVGINSTVLGNKFFGSHRYWTKETNSTGSALNLVEGTDNGANYVALKAPDNISTNVTYTLPGVQGGSATVLTNDGSGNLSWSSGSSNATFTGITTFSDTTNNTLGISSSGSVQIFGGVGIAKNLTVGSGLSVGNTLFSNQLNVTGVTTLGIASVSELYVTGVSTFVGSVTFQGGTINLGDANNDNINVAGEFISNLTPNTDNTYDIGIGTQRWRNAEFSGFGTFYNLYTSDGMTVGSNLQVGGNLNVDGTVTIGGTSVFIAAETLTVRDKDIVLGFTTYPNDNTANHGGIAIASTVGSPLIPLQSVGINTLPDTYKQMMWVKEGTWTGLGTDAFLFNYAVGIGSTQVPYGVRLAVGNVTVTDNTVTAANINADTVTANTGNFTNFVGGTVTGTISTATRANTVDTVTASNLNALHYLTFVNSHNGSATPETVYTDDGIYYNPGTNTFTTQYANFTGDVTVAGTLTGTATTATRATLVDTTGTTTDGAYYVPFIDGPTTGQTGETLRVGIGLSVNPSTGNVGVSSILSVGNINETNAYIKAGGGSNAMYLQSNGDVSFQAKVVANNYRSSSNASNTLTFNDLDATFARDLTVTGFTTTSQFYASGISTFASAALVRNVRIGSANANTIDTSTGGLTLDSASGMTTVNDDLTITGSLFVQGSTTQVDTTSMTVEDRTIELGKVDGAAPGTATTWDLGVLFNYNATGSPLLSGVVWETSSSRFKFASDITDSGGTGVNNPQITFTTYAPIEISSLWVNDCAGSSQVISCTAGVRNLENITIDCGTF